MSHIENATLKINAVISRHATASEFIHAADEEMAECSFAEAKEFLDTMADTFAAYNDTHVPAAARGYRTAAEDCTTADTTLAEAIEETAHPEGENALIATQRVARFIGDSAIGATALPLDIAEFVNKVRDLARDAANLASRQNIIEEASNGAIKSMLYGSQHLFSYRDRVLRPKPTE